MKFTKSHLESVARAEAKEWRNLPSGLVIAILFAFVHRATTGQTVDELMQELSTPATDYQI